MCSNGRRLTRSYAIADLALATPSSPAVMKRGRSPETSSAAPGGTTLPPAITADTGCDEPPPQKKSKANDGNDGAASSVQSGKRASKMVPPRSPLPVRSNRVIHPGAPDQKNPRRTSAQVAADNKRKEDLKRDLDALAQKQIEILAQMEVDQAIADELENQEAIGCLADVEAIEEDIDSGFGNSEYGSDTDMDGEDKTDTPKVPAVCHVPTGVVRTKTMHRKRRLKREIHD
jgi:hypothetical protein